MSNHPYPSIILAVGGFISILWAKLETEEKKTKNKTLTLFFQFLGFCWGLTALTWGIITFSSTVYSNWTPGLLVVVGLSMFLKPLKNIPWASLVSLLISGGITIIIALNMPPIPFLGIDFRWILAVVFLALLFILYVIFKFIEDLFKLIGLILSNDPMSLLIGIVTFVGGIASAIIAA